MSMIQAHALNLSFGNGPSLNQVLHDVSLSHLTQRFARSGVAVLLLVLLQPHRLSVVTQAPGQRMAFLAAGDLVGRADGGQRLDAHT